MMVTNHRSLEIMVTKTVDAYSIKTFQERPWKMGKEKPVSRIGAFELFNLFTADIIRSKKVFTR